MDVETAHCSECLCVRMSGEYTDDTPFESHPASLARTCRDGNYRCLLIDASDLAGEIGPGVYFRFGEEIAKAFAFNVIRIAIAGNAERVKQLSLVEKIVTRQGGILKVFADVGEAQEWLMQ